MGKKKGRNKKKNNATVFNVNPNYDFSKYLKDKDINWKIIEKRRNQISSSEVEQKEKEYKELRQMEEALEKSLIDFEDKQNEELEELIIKLNYQELQEKKLEIEDSRTTKDLIESEINEYKNVLKLLDNEHDDLKISIEEKIKCLEDEIESDYEYDEDESDSDFGEESTFEDENN